ACTKALSAFSWTAPTLPGFENSRVICRTLGMEALDWSCAETMVQQANASEMPRTERPSKFMDANLQFANQPIMGRGRTEASRTTWPATKSAGFQSYQRDGLTRTAKSRRSVLNRGAGVKAKARARALCLGTAGAIGLRGKRNPNNGNGTSVPILQRGTGGRGNPQRADDRAGRRRGPRKRRRSDDGRGKDYAGSHQLHGQAWPRADLHAADRRALRRAAFAADVADQHLGSWHGFYRSH